MGRYIVKMYLLIICCYNLCCNLRVANVTEFIDNLEKDSVFEFEGGNFSFEQVVFISEMNMSLIGNVSDDELLLTTLSSVRFEIVYSNITFENMIFSCDYSRFLYIRYDNNVSVSYCIIQNGNVNDSIFYSYYYLNCIRINNLIIDNLNFSRYGGFLYFDGPDNEFYLNNSKFNNCNFTNSDYGGLFYFFNCGRKIVFENSLFSSIIASGYTGVIMYFVSFSENGPNIENCTFSNISGRGGGVFYLECCEGYVNITKSTFRECCVEEEVFFFFFFNCYREELFFHMRSL
jgi:hypothetical protein